MCASCPTRILFQSCASIRGAIRAWRATFTRSPQTGEFLRRVEGLLIYLIPHYIREGKSYLTIAFGCTGGRHRSVMLAEAVSKTLHKKGYGSKVVHRDLAK